MRKLITLLAALSLAAASFAMAEPTTGNASDPLTQIQPAGSEATAPTTLADADTSAPAAASADQGTSDPEAKPVHKAKHHKKHCKNCKHHCKAHHHKKHAPTPASEHEMTPETSAPAAQ